MDMVLEFIAEYIWYIALGLIVIFAVIGFVATKKKEKELEQQPEPTEEEVPVKEEEPLAPEPEVIEEEPSIEFSEPTIEETPMMEQPLGETPRVGAEDLTGETEVNESLEDDQLEE